LKYEFTWITKQEKFNLIKNKWKTIFEKDINSSIFLSWEWVSNWWKIFSNSKSLEILTVYNQSKNELIAILPLYKSRSKILCLNLMWEWRFIGSDSIACSDHLGILTQTNLEQEEFNLIFDELLKNIGDFAVLKLTDLQPTDPIIKNIISWAKNHSIKVKIEPDTTCPCVELSNTWDDYLMRLSSNFRSQIRSSYRKILNNDDMTIRSVTDNQEIIKYINELAKLNISRMDQKNQKSSFLQQTMQQFLVNLATDMVQTGQAWLDIILHENRLVAASLHLVHRNTVYYYQGGFDPEYSKWRPSTVLFAHVMQRAIENEYIYFDFLRGNEKYKYRWGASQKENITILLLPDNILNRAGYTLSKYINKAINVTRKISSVFH